MRDIYSSSGSSDHHNMMVAFGRGPLVSSGVSSNGTTLGRRSQYSSNSSAYSSSGLRESAQFANILVEFEHDQKEMAVDVPDSFVAQTKTPPKYPPPFTKSNRNSVTSIGNYSKCSTSSIRTQNGDSPDSGLPVSQSQSEYTKESKMSKMSSALSLSSKSPETNNSSSHIGDQKTSTPKSNAEESKPTAEQSLRIKGYSKDIRNKKMVAERHTKNNEFLRLSMRNSQKIKRLMNANISDKKNARDGATATSLKSNEDPIVSFLHATQRLEVLSAQKQHANLFGGVVEKMKYALDEIHNVMLSKEFQQAHQLQQKVEILKCNDQSTLRPDGDPLFPSTLDSATLLNTCLSFLNDSFPKHNSHDQQQQEEVISNDHAMARELISILNDRGGSFHHMFQVHDQVASMRVESESSAVGDETTSSNEPRSEIHPPPPHTHTFLTDEEAIFRRITNYSQPNIKVIQIEKNREPLGATVKNEEDAVLIARIMRGGTAEASGLLKEGDELLEINEIPLRGKHVNEVCDILANLEGILTLLVVPCDENVAYSTPIDHTDSMSGRASTPHHDTMSMYNQHQQIGGILHIKALMDYDPEDDPYLPCKELGLSFRKGDILHVMNQSDMNWWQARREGEDEDPNHPLLPGLIPSPRFQEQRETIKLTLARDVAGHMTTSRRRKKMNKMKTLATSRSLLAGGLNTCDLGIGGTLGRKNRSNHKRTASLSSSSCWSGVGVDLTHGELMMSPLDSPVLVTYEEVTLYYPRSDRKRPVVLIGPPNIGRHDLRQKLMQDSQRFAAAIPHTSRPRRPDETAGQDYHFISRLQFEQDIMSRKFVEHGEYEKAYYGTSIEAIRRVVRDQNKICVLNLHPQSLVALRQPQDSSSTATAITQSNGGLLSSERSKHLMPFAVFVAPPSLEKLRKWKMERGEPSGDMELRDTIERARLIEQTYGHLFDMVIVYSNPDKAYQDLLKQINLLEREPQWVPAGWLS